MTYRLSRVLVALLAPLPALTSCFPSTTPISDPGQMQSSGNLSYGSLGLAWSVGNTWEQGQCVDLVVTNNGSALNGWNMAVQLSASVETFLSSSGSAPLTASGDTLTIDASSLPLAHGANQTFQYCAEPQTAPKTILSAELEEEEASPTPQPPTPTPPPVTGSLQSDPLVMTFRQKGASAGGECLELAFTNVSTKPLASWYVQLGMSGVVNWTDYWNCAIVTDGSSLTLYPGAGGGELGSYQAWTATVCLDPLVKPVSMKAVVQYKAS